MQALRMHSKSSMEVQPSGVIFLSPPSTGFIEVFRKRTEQTLWRGVSGEVKAEAARDSGSCDGDGIAPVLGGSAVPGGTQGQRSPGDDIPHRCSFSQGPQASPSHSLAIHT